MTAPRRTSLKDRRAAAIKPSEPQPEVATSPPQVTPQRPPQHKPGKSTTEPGERGAKTAAGETARVGIYLSADEFSAAKAAYLADWNAGGEASTFARWVAEAIEDYAEQTPQQRDVWAEPQGRGSQRRGSSRSFTIPTETVAAMRGAITADHQAGRWPSDSAWCAEALSWAVEQARGRSGGTLPSPPPRLPNRLAR